MIIITDKDRISNMIDYLVYETENDNINWVVLTTYPDIKCKLFKTMIKVSGNKFVNCLMYSTLGKTGDPDMNKLTLFLEKSDLSRKKISDFYFSDNKDLYFLGRLVWYKTGEKIDPYRKKRMDLLTFVDHIRDQMNAVVVERKAKQSINKYLLFKKKEIRETYSLVELLRIEDQLYTYVSDLM